MRKAAASKRAGGQGGALLCFGGDGTRDRIGARHRRGGDLVQSVYPDDFFNQIGLAMDIRTPRRRYDFQHAVAGEIGNPRLVKNLLDCLFRQLETAKAFDFGSFEADGAAPFRGPAGNGQSGGLAATEVENQLRRELQTGNRRIPGSTPRSKR